MMCRLRTTLFLVACGVTLGCSGHDSTGEVALERKKVDSAGFGLTPDECQNLSIRVPENGIPLDSPFNVAAVSNWPSGAYSWDGEGVRVVAQNAERATLRCSWPGWHTIEVTATSDRCSVTRTKQIQCVPTTCSSYASPSQCPGVLLTEEDADCPKTNVIVRIPNDGVCATEIPGAQGQWLGGHLIDAPYRASDQRARFCGYHWSGRPGSTPDIRGLPADPSDWQWDCPGVAAHGDYSEMHAALAAHGQANLGTIEWTSPVQTPVRVAVVDTAAGQWRDADNNPHGKAVGTLIEDTACRTPANCSVRVENFLGLPLLRDSDSLAGQAVIRRDVVDGGGFGSKGDLTRAIVEAIRAGNGENTVLNLSVAYEADGLLDSLWPREGDFANRVVLEALRFARCSGALIVAAAGNGRVPAHRQQLPGLPARWTALRALDSDTCEQRFRVSKFSNDAPLLYAVSAVDFGARPLLTTRGRGQSVLAALGFAVVREEPDGGFTRTLTGTSMAAATFSGIAASFWAHDDTLSPDDVVRELYEHGEPVAAEPDFRPATSPELFTEVRRITLCSAVGDLGLAKCTKPAEAIATVPDTILTDLPADARQAEVEEPIEVPRGLSPWHRPWVRPQPEGEPGCGACGLKLSQNRLDLILRQAFLNKTVKNMRLLVSRSSAASIASLTGGGLTDDVPVEIASFTPLADPFSVPLDEADLGAPVAAELAYQIEIDGVDVDTTESVLIEPEEEVPLF